MKALIFDVDNTLIDWKDEFIFALHNVLMEMNYNFTEEEIKKIDKVIDEHDKYLDVLNVSDLLNIVNKNCNLNLPSSFIEKLIIAQGECFYQDDSVNKTLEYLSQKYDLYVISNWFTETQKIRLEKMGIAKYFKKIIGADINYSKPDIRVFDIILKDYKKEECTYIGDNLNTDIIPAISAGMNAIWKTSIDTNEYQTIRKIEDLMNIF